MSTCPLREEKPFSQRAFLILRIFANYKIKLKLLSKLFGVLANTDFILVSTYEENGSNPELVLYKKR